MAYKRYNDNKYAAKRCATTIGGQLREFDSKTERDRYLTLLAYKQRGDIITLHCQRRFTLIPQLTETRPVRLKTKTKMVERIIERAAVYTADFVYLTRDGRCVIEEVKSRGTMLARDYPLRRKLVRWLIRLHNDRRDRRNWCFNEVIK